MSSYIAFDLDAIGRVGALARAMGITEAEAAWGLVRLWEWCWRQKAELAEGIHLRGFFGCDAGPALVAFGFAEAAGTSWRVKGASRYLRIQEGRAKGGRAAAGNLKRGQKPGASREAAGRQPGLVPGLSASSDERAANSEQLKKISPVKRPSRKSAGASAGTLAGSQPGLPGLPHPPPPELRAKSEGEDFWETYQDERASVLVALGGDPAPEKAPPAVFQNTVWLNVLKMANRPTKLEAFEDAVEAMHLFFKESWAAKMEPPFAFNGFVSGKVLPGLLAKVRGEPVGVAS